MTIEISRETEIRLTDEARKLGISVDELLGRLVGEPAAATTEPIQGGATNLPVWHLGGVGPLHRRDVYDDAR